ncbi:MAG: tagaturonate reductase [Synergistaceae bacterium]|nr:tagaturonate reductase [Synergistaceae bacterium]MBQ3448414.1 tagaturonate reductase [Synergistaceae bacterium]MBQ3694460.1 tagaturonate reductase [Synergistaceae bacterium]MBQ6111228.1 tagaturonate reductase [Synergistaceae bacterium]MBQ9629411.1 tagaturonate reductase [Synergistaceae bacterium]
MSQLNYQVLKESGYDGFVLEHAPEKVMQFGEGNFLRAFADDFFDIANEKAGFNGKVVMVQPIASGLSELINKQEGLYTLYLRGNEKGRKVDDKRLISCCSRALNPYGEWDKVLELARSKDLEIIVSNTTEAGIVHESESKFDQTPPISFPAKLTRVLYERFKAGLGGLVILSCELIDNNGKELLRCVNEYIKDWGLDDAFKAWVNDKNIFCSTLVDRIVPGRIRNPEEVKALNAANGYEDELIDVGEVFGVWIIEGPAGLEDRLPFKKAGVPVHVVPDVTPYKKRKVRILNGAHTGFVLGAYLAGFDIVRDCMNNDTIRGFMNKMLYDEVIPTLPLDKNDLIQFAEAVQDRFNNPFVNHELMSISLNSASKWKARNMPSFLEYVEEHKKLPVCLTMSLAAFIAFYSNQIQELNDKGLVCKRPKGNTYTISDDRWVLEFFYDHRNDSPEALVHAVLSDTKMWDMNLAEIAGLEDAVISGLKKIRTEGAEAAYKSCL